MIYEKFPSTNPATFIDYIPPPFYVAITDINLDTKNNNPVYKATYGCLNAETKIKTLIGTTRSKILRCSLYAVLNSNHSLYVNYLLYLPLPLSGYPYLSTDVSLPKAS